MFEYINIMVRISNLELLKKLRENSRVHYTQLARHFGVTETAIRKRIKKLEESGVIVKYTIDINPKKIGFESVALIGIDTKPEKYIKTIEELKRMKEVFTLCSSSGDHMILAECWFKNSKELSDFIKKIGRMDGVLKVCPAIITEKIKC